MKKIITGAALAAMIAAAVPTSSFASHYELRDIGLVSAEVEAKLAADKITNTETMLAKLMGKQDRADFAQKYGISKEETETLANRLELMQIVGVGPKASLLLTLAGIDGAKSLSEANPEALLSVLLRVNREKAITGVHPDIAVVRDWITRATKVIHFIER